MRSVDFQYGKFLYLLAKREGKVDFFYEFVDCDLLPFFLKDFVSDFFSNPSVSLDDKVSLLIKFFGTKLDSFFISFLRKVIKNRRITCLVGILEIFADFHELEEGILRLRVTVAPGISDFCYNQILEVSKIIFGIKKLKIEKLVDGSIVGGYVLCSKDKFFDFSLKGLLDRLNFLC